MQQKERRNPFIRSEEEMLLAKLVESKSTLRNQCAESLTTVHRFVSANDGGCGTGYFRGGRRIERLRQSRPVVLIDKKIKLVGELRLANPSVAHYFFARISNVSR